MPIDIGLSRLPSTETFIDENPSYPGAVTKHLGLLNFGRDVASELIKDPRIQEAADPALLHNDLHKRNIRVLDEDPTIISDIIGWQSTSINPALMHAKDQPDFAASFSTPDEHSPSEDRPSGDNTNLCNRGFTAGVSLLVTKISMSWELDDDIVQFFEYCHRSTETVPESSDSC